MSSAVEIIVVIIFLQLVYFARDFYMGAANAIGVASHGSAKENVPLLIACCVVITQHHIPQLIILIRHKKPHESRAVICEVCLHSIFVLQQIQVCLFPFFCPAESCDFVFFHSGFLLVLI